ncbi:MAG: alpha/beta hydrolase [Pseudomonadota bacterium]
MSTQDQTQDQKRDRVQVEAVTYQGTGGHTLQGNLYHPPQPNGVGILLIHGGSYVQGDRAQLHGYGIQLGRLGYTSLACEYRLAPQHKWPAQLDDVQDALGLFHQRAAELSVSTDSIVAWGNSAGGQLALMAAALQAHPIAATVALYAPADFLGPGARALGAPQAMQFLVGDEDIETVLHNMSPLNHARADFPPTLLMTGNQDELVAWQDSHALYLKLLEAGAACELHVFDGAAHAFDLQPQYGRLCVTLGDVFLKGQLAAP